MNSDCHSLETQHNKLNETSKDFAIDWLNLKSKQRWYEDFRIKTEITDLRRFIAGKFEIN